VAKRRRKRKGPKHTAPKRQQLCFDFGPAVPTYDFFEYIDLEDLGFIDQALDNLIRNIKTERFLQWEAVMHKEQGLRLTRKHKKALSSLISFSDEDEPIWYIDEIPRPSKPWYEIARQIVPRILCEPFRTDEGMYEAMYEGWPTLVEVMETHARDLSLPEGVETPLDLFPLDLRHGLWLQVCFDALSGLGQEEGLTLENQPDRTDWFIRCLREHKDTVQYFDLTLECLPTRVLMPPRDERILVEMMMEQLGLNSLQEHLADFL